MARAASSELDDMIDEEASKRSPPSSDALERVLAVMRQARDNRAEAADAQTRLTELNTAYWKITTETLPTMFNDLGITSLTLKAEGNMPAMDAEARPYYKANIAADWSPERREAAFKWLRSNKLGDLVKAKYSVQFGMKTEKIQKALAAFLKKSKIDYEKAESVHPSTLTAVVKDMIEREKKSPPLETLGATVGTVVSMKEVKTTTTSRRS